MSYLVPYQILIDGQWVDAADGSCFESIDPSTGKAWASVPEATADDVHYAVKAAERAMYEGPWSRMTPTERGKCLRRLGDLLR